MQFLKVRPVPGDLWGGLSAAAVVLPQAMAFGVTLLAGYGFPAAQSALTGLISATMVCLVSGLVGGTSGLITAPTGPGLILLSGALAALASQGIAGSALLLALAAVVMLAGLFQVLIGLSGGGRLIKYIPYPVISGFMTGSAILMIRSQLRPLTGSDIQALGAHWLWLPAATALVTALSTWLLPRVFSKVPGTIAGLLTGTLFFHLALLFSATAVPGAWVIGQLPPLHSIGFALTTDEPYSLPWSLILLSALALSVLASLDTLLTSVIADVTTMNRHSARTELTGQGIGHLLAGALGGMAAAGTTGATMVAISSGGRRWTAVVAALTFPLLLLVGSGAGTALPVSVLSGIILYVAMRMVDLDILAWLRNRRTHSDAFIALLVTLITVFYDLMVAVAAGVSIAIILFIRSQVLASVVHLRSTGKQLRSVRKRSQAEREALLANGEQIVLYELRGNLIFATTDALLDKVAPDLVGGKIVILHLRRVQQIDLTAARLLQQLASRLEQAGGMLLVCDLYHEIGFGEVAEKALCQFNFSAQQVPIRTFNGKDEALEFAENTLLTRLHMPPSASWEFVDLADSELCQSLTAAELQQLRKVLRAHSLAAGEYIFHAGDAGNSLLLVIKGEIEMHLPTTRHHYKRLATCQAGTYFGELALLNPGPRIADGIASHPSELLELDSESLEQLQLTSPQIVIKLLRTLAKIEVEHLRWTTHELQHLAEW